MIHSTEACDDFNTADGDGCSSACAFEVGATCFTDQAGKTVCDDCGNGIYKSEIEACDDGNTADGDGCSSTCTEESNFTCDNE